MPEPEKKKVKTIPDAYELYLIHRNQIINHLDSQKTGNKLILDDKEKKVMKKLALILHEEIEMLREKDQLYFADNFFGGKEFMEKESKLFKCLKNFPKGAALHNHWIACGQAEWVLEQLLTMDGVYICTEEQKDPRALKGFWAKGACRFWNNPPEGWVKLKDVREKSGDVKAFDKKILSEMTFCLEDEIGTSENRWIKFQGIFDKYYFGLIFYEGLVKKFHQHVVDSFSEDNIQYAEFRSHFGNMVYKGDAEYISAEDQVKLFAECDQVTQSDDWIGSKFIHESLRFHDRDYIRKQLELSLELQNKYPETIVAFDLVGEEDTGKSAFYYSEDVVAVREQAKNENKKFKTMFHGGETNWPTENLVDIVLQGSCRIGHGYNLYRFPALLQLVKEKDIALEFCPVSNQVMGLVKDQRNHPICHYIGMDVPFTINSDDCGIFGYAGVTHDWYLLAMSNQLSLRQLKQIALNSIKFSSVNDEDRTKLLGTWQKKYEEWLDFMLNFE